MIMLKSQHLHSYKFNDRKKCSTKFQSYGLITRVELHVHRPPFTNPITRALLNSKFLLRSCHSVLQPLRKCVRAKHPIPVAAEGGG